MSIAAGLIDARELPPAVRTPLIVVAIDALSPGEGFDFVIGDDPRPLYALLERTRARLYDLRLVEAGPARWKVRITRRACVDPVDDPAAACAVG